MQNLSITYLGHSAFSLTTPGGKDVLFDPWYTGNPSFPAGREPKAADLILLSHGHSDHSADAAAVAKRTGATVVGIYEITSWLGAKGVTNLEPMNKGGTIHSHGLRITMTDARHSSSVDDGTYLGEPAGFVVGLENGQTIYFAGDTSLFGDMKLIARALPPRHRVPAHRRPLHHGPRHGGHRGALAGREAGGAHALGHVPAAHRHARHAEDPPGRQRHRRARTPAGRHQPSSAACRAGRQISIDFVPPPSDQVVGKRAPDLRPRSSGRPGRTTW